MIKDEQITETGENRNSSIEFRSDPNKITIMYLKRQFNGWRINLPNGMAKKNRR